jgi:hypothetical protein
MGTLNRNLQTMPSLLTMSVPARENMPAHDHALVAKSRVNDGHLNTIGAIIVVLESKLVKVKEKQAQLQEKAILMPLLRNIDHQISIEKSDRCGYQVKFRQKMTGA